jgi:hypothetical protein
MANTTNDRPPLTEQDIEPVEELLRTLKGKAREAHTAGNALLLSFYVDLIKVVSPRVNRLHARVERETLASIRKEHKTLKQHGRA